MNLNKKKNKFAEVASCHRAHRPNTWQGAQSSSRLGLYALVWAKGPGWAVRGSKWRQVSSYRVFRFFAGFKWGKESRGCAGKSTECGAELIFFFHFRYTAHPPDCYNKRAFLCGNSRKNISFLKYGKLTGESNSAY